MHITMATTNKQYVGIPTTIKVFPIAIIEPNIKITSRQVDFERHQLLFIQLYLHVLTCLINMTYTLLGNGVFFLIRTELKNEYSSKNHTLNNYTHQFIHTCMCICKFSSHFQNTLEKNNKNQI